MSRKLDLINRLVEIILIWDISITYIADPDLCRYYIVVWRRTAFYMVNYILPAFLINVISLFVFMMPSESGEKITLGISAMLNMTVNPPLPSTLIQSLLRCSSWLLWETFRLQRKPPSSVNKIINITKRSILVT